MKRSSAEIDVQQEALLQGTCSATMAEILVKYLWNSDIIRTVTGL